VTKNHVFRMNLNLIDLKDNKTTYTKQNQVKNKNEKWLIIEDNSLRYNVTRSIAPTIW